MSCDRISELPDSLLTQVLSYLPTKDSVKTSVLSKRWECLWLNVPVLDLKVSDFPEEDYASFIDNFLEFNPNSRMQMFKIKYDEYTYDDDRLLGWFGGSPLELGDLRKRDTIRDFLIGVSSVRQMIISQPTLEVLHRYSKLGPIPKFDNLYRLQATISWSMLHLLLGFLESFPNLKNLILDFVVSTEPEQDGLKLVPQCLLSSLESVEIRELVMGEETGKKLVKYFLENSLVLQKLTLRFEDYSISNQDSDIFKELYTFTKGSRSCEVIFH
ncbi:F-box/FBD/LRR-repeat protein At2g26030 isoform X2 [Capsella rubella]|uniref:F-box/FBD/LRR-repeat protein At2g26030 isoform X2 n=1 Tax=Capsella rubella TaxID=81985 RepID=UPI000CD558F2|nr:F-box/FBD/LRR-repeat protein At2g26030 isoform X2 [Capsella rubella]